MENNLDGSGYDIESQESTVSAWPFLVGAAFVGALIALVVVKVSLRFFLRPRRHNFNSRHRNSSNASPQKRKQESEEGHPLEGSVKKQMKLVNGGIFRRSRSEKSATLTEEIIHEDSIYEDMEVPYDGTDFESSKQVYVEIDEIDESVKTSGTQASKMSRASSFRAALSRAGSKLSIGRSRSGAQQAGSGKGTYNAPQTMGFDDETIESEADYARGVEL